MSWEESLSARLNSAARAGAGSQGWGAFGGRGVGSVAVCFESSSNDSFIILAIGRGNDHIGLWLKELPDERRRLLGC